MYGFDGFGFDSCSFSIAADLTNPSVGNGVITGGFGSCYGLVVDSLRFVNDLVVSGFDWSYGRTKTLLRVSYALVLFNLGLGNSHLIVGLCFSDNLVVGGFDWSYGRTEALPRVRNYLVVDNFGVIYGFVKKVLGVGTSSTIFRFGFLGGLVVGGPCFGGKRLSRCNRVRSVLYVKKGLIENCHDFCGSEVCRAGDTGNLS